MRNNDSDKVDIFESVTSGILAALESGVGGWEKPWMCLGTNIPVNVTTGKKYRGINTLILSFEQYKRGFVLPNWLTFKQALDKGGNVRKGEKGTKVIFWKFLERTNKESGKKETFPMCRAYTVFNVAQCDNLPEAFTKVPELPAVTGEREDIDAFILALRSKITHGGDRAFYSKIDDAITMPEKGQFPSMNDYYSTLFHEHIHWTGHENRCKRMLGERFGSEAYAAEELVAEIGSAYLCAKFGVSGKLQHAEYVQNWIKVLKGDKHAIFKAASLAQEAFDTLMDKGGLSSQNSDTVQEDSEEAA